MPDTSKPSDGWPPLKVFAVVTGGVFAFWLVWGWVIGPWLAPQLSERGLLGDSFGALNTLFAGLAFAGVIAALVMQMTELRLQREELKLLRAEHAQQRELLEERFSFDRERVSQEAQPLLERDVSSKEAVRFINKGARVEKVNFVSATEDVVLKFPDPRRVMDREESKHVWFKGSGGVVPDEFHFRFCYLDRTNSYNEQYYRFIVNGGILTRLDRFPD